MIGLYYSVTGNSQYCLSAFLKEIDSQAPCYSIFEKDIISAIRKEDEIVIAYPIYYSNISGHLRRFVIENQDIWEGKSVYVIATMHQFSGDGAGVLARLLHKYGAEIKGGLHICVPDFAKTLLTDSNPDPVKMACLNKSRKKITAAAGQYRSGHPTRNGLSIFHWMMGFFGQRMLLGYKVNKNNL